MVSKTMVTNLFLALSKYHPVVIEGMGSYDPRDPAIVAKQIASRLQLHWQDEKPVDKPKLIITQGDPLAERGISAITPGVASEFGLERALVILDDHIAPHHSPNADRDNVIMEFQYSQLVGILNENEKDIIFKLEAVVDQHIEEKNKKRAKIGKPPLKDYFRDFALLQEVTKAACRQICGDITVVHTAHEISEFSVTSFYTAGLELGLVKPGDMVTYGESDELDFEQLEKNRYDTK